MSKVPGYVRYVMAGAGVAAWLLIVVTDPARAQETTDDVFMELDTASARETGKLVTDPSVTFSGRVDEFSTKGTGGIPDFIMESTYYTLGVDDVIEISVLRHPEVSGQYIINNEGKIQYEFVGDLRIEGLKKDEVKDLLVRALKEYIISPDVTVKIVGYNSKIVYVIGEVGRPGKIFMKGDTITVREALVQAGLPLLSAKATKCHLITPSVDGKPEDKRVNVHKLLYEGDLRENLIMKPGDTLYVPPTFLAKTMRVIQPVTQPVREAGGTAGTVYGF